MKHLATTAATTIVVLFLLVAAVPLMHWFEEDGREAAFESNRALWRSHAIPDYRFELRVACDCALDGARRRIDVIGGSTKLIEVLAGAANRRSDLPETLDQLFAVVRRSLDSEPTRIHIVYDMDYGFPRLVEVSERRADSPGLSLYVDEFMILR